MGNTKYTYEFVKETIEKDGNKLLSKEYKNGKTPMDIKCGKCGVEYQQKFSQYKKGYKCKKCSYQKFGKNHRLSVEKLKTLMSSKGDKLLDTYYVKDSKGRNELKVRFICGRCKKEFDLKYSWYKRRPNCKCERIKQKLDYDIVKQYFEESGETLMSSEYLNCYTELEIKCATCDKIYRTTWQRFRVGTRCSSCQKYGKNDYDEIKKFVENRGDKLIGKIPGIEIECGKCGHKYQMVYAIYKGGQGCTKCAAKRRAKKLKNTQAYVKNYIKKYGDTLCSKYINGRLKLDIKCGKCGDIFKMSFNHYQSGDHRCKCHSMSRGERMIKHYCDTKNIKYDIQKKFDECVFKKELPFDFYLPEYDLLIEYDGKAHFVQVDHFGEDYLEYRRQNDVIKNVFCHDNGKKLLRIPYTDYKNIDLILDKYIKYEFTETIIYTDIVVYEEMINDTLIYRNDI